MKYRSKTQKDIDQIKDKETQEFVVEFNKKYAKHGLSVVPNKRKGDLK